MNALLIIAAEAVGGGLIAVLFHLLIAVVIIAVIFLVAAKLLPSDWVYIVKIILGVILLIYLINLLLPFISS